MIAELITETVQQEETDMKRYITFISCFIVLCGLLGCTDERWLENGSATENTGGIPIEFVMDFAPITPSSRADTQIEEKTEFADGDIIQIVANFYKKNESNPFASDLMEDKSVCCILTYQQEGNEMGKWVNNSGIPLYWPWDADNASFSAFYYPGFNGVLDINNNKTLPVLLDSLDVTTDPLMAEEVTDISYGNAVHLTFKHKCTRLILTDLDEVTGGASYSKLWLENTGINTEDRENAFQLELKEDKDENYEKGKYLFDFQFVKKEDSNNRVLIGGNTIDITDGSKALVLFLPPGNYSKVSLTRRFGRPLFSWDNVERLEELKEGVSYTVSLKDLLGNITIDDDEEWWTDEEYIPTVEDTEFDLDEFLKSIGNGRSYSYQKNGTDVVVLEEVPVLEETGKKHLVLRKNINFQNKTDFVEVEVGSTTILEGDGHFFKNVSKPAFKRILGTVQNLGITKSTAVATLSVGTSSTTTACFGILTRESSGTVKGIRLDEIDITITLSTSGSFFVGALLGDNVSSPTTDIEVNDISIKVNKATLNGSLMLGGLIGQNGINNASLENVNMCGDENISVVNEANGGNIYVGGLVGVSASNISNCKVRATVDNSAATGLWMYTGGLVGSMRNPDADDHIRLEDSQNEGTVTGGTCEGVSAAGESSTGHSSTGGLVGYSLRADITNCLVSGTVSSAIGVNGNNDPDGVKAYYTIGGIAGAVRAVDSSVTDRYPKVSDNTVYAEVTNQTVEGFCYVGWLSGIAPTNVTKEPSNKCWVTTTLQNVGLEDNSAPTGQPGT